MTHTSIRIILLTSILAMMGACASPLGDRSSQHRVFQASVLETFQRELEGADAEPHRLEQAFASVELPISEEVREELETMAGPNAYVFGEAPLGEDLAGLSHRSVGVTLAQVLRTTVQNNLQVEFARLEPAIEEAQLVQAMAAFDWVLFSNLNYEDIDTPRQQGSIFGGSVDEQEGVDWTAGVRRRLTTGGQFAVQQEYMYTDDMTPRNLLPDPAHRVTYSVQLDQPLLRGFGSNVALSEVRLARNQERDAIARLKAQLVDTITEAERLYWRLYSLYRTLNIQQALIDRGIEMSEILEARGFEVINAQLAEAAAQVARRRSNLTETQNAVREVSDQLRVLMNDPSIPIGSEVLLLPLDEPLEAPIEYNYRNALLTAIRHRPEVRQAILSLDNTSIRRTVAANGLLPRLDLRIQARLNSLEDSPGEAYAEPFDDGFVEWLVGLVFEMPIGNRAAKAALRVTTLQRLQATTAYRQTVQSVVQEVRRALYNLQVNYQLVAQRRLERVAATESLRSLRISIETTGSYNPNSITNLLNRQEALAAAERAEAEAMAQYNVALAELHAALGLALERNQIEFVVPSPAESFDWPEAALDDE